MSCLQGVTFPAAHGIWRHWAPSLERTRLATLAFCGCYAGVIFAMPVSTSLVTGLGWQAPFYFYGCVGLVWLCSWLWLVFEKPSLHPTIETTELLYIQNSLGDTNSKTMLRNVPWKSLFTSMPVYAIFVANFCKSWNFYLLILFQAAYMRDVFSMEMKEVRYLFFMGYSIFDKVTHCLNLSKSL